MRAKPKERVPCDCPIEQLMADYEEAKTKFPGKPLYWGLLPWSDTHSHMLCKRHNVYCGITHDPLRGSK